MIVLELLTALLIAHSTRGVSLCNYESRERTKSSVDAIVNEVSLENRIAATQDLTESWRTKCRGKRIPPYIVVELSRLLPVPSSTYPAAFLFYAMGGDAKIAAPQIHAAYREVHRQNRDLLARQPLILGADILAERALLCLDVRMRTGRTMKHACASLAAELKSVEQR